MRNTSAPPFDIGKNAIASLTVSSSTSLMLLPLTFTSRTSTREAGAVAIRAAQVDVGKELHLDVLKAGVSRSGNGRCRR